MNVKTLIRERYDLAKDSYEGLCYLLGLVAGLLLSDMIDIRKYERYNKFIRQRMITVVRNSRSDICGRQS